MIVKLCIWFGICASSLTGSNVYVVDGDTIRLDGYHSQSIRLQGIDAEELTEPNGPAAKKAMELLTVFKEVTCVPDGTTSYERVVARCFIGHRDLGELMVEGGWALDCARYSGGRYRRFEPAGARAKLIQKGYCR